MKEKKPDVKTMEIEFTEQYNFKLKKVFVPLVLETSSGDELSIAMRDSGFEIFYRGKFLELKEGRISWKDRNIKE